MALHRQKSNSGRVHRTGQVRLNVHHATVKSIRKNVKSHRRRILKAQKLRRRLDKIANDLSASSENECSDGIRTQVTSVLKKMVSTDSDELEVDGGCSEEDQEEALVKRMAGHDVEEDQEERGFEVDSGCDEWDLSKDNYDDGFLCVGYCD